MRYTHIKASPVPTCPNCKSVMILRKPRPNQAHRPFWSCSKWPTCDGTRKAETKDDLMPWDDLDVWREVRIYD